MRLLVLLLLTSCATAVHRPTTAADEEDQESGCGSLRVQVKHMTDDGAGDVDLGTIEDTTVEQLAGLKAPPWHDAETRGELEKHVYRVTGDVTGYGLEDDNDIHVVLQGTSGQTMVVELVDPDCSNGSPAKKAIKVARQLWVAKLGKPYSKITMLEDKGLPPIRNVTFTGVGFWDKKHNGLGCAPNHVELHPVLSVEGL